MTRPLHQKSSIHQIRERFDQDVERFSNLETGQSATIDAPLSMDLITSAAISSTKTIRRVLDIGCGAGNNTLKLREKLGSDFHVDLLDLSDPMVQRASERLSQVSQCTARKMVGDFRVCELETEAYDIVLAAAVLHHLRDDSDWQSAFEKIYRVTAPGGSVWITDLVSHETDGVHEMMWARYGEYLTGLGGDEYREKVFQYIDMEDSPRSLTYQTELLRRVGFSQVEILHKHSCFAAFGAIKL